MSLGLSQPRSQPPHSVSHAPGCARAWLGLVGAAMLAALAGCANMQVDNSGSTSREPLCQRSGEAVPALVLWQAQWRANQKEPALREEAARRGIERFFAESGCFTPAQVRQTLAGQRAGASLSPAEVRDLAMAEPVPAQRAVFISVRELGPVLKLLSSLALVDGGTEVVLDFKIMATQTGETLGDFRTHWRNGGPWVIKGVATLEDDMVSALHEALRPGQAAR
jgi:hypothetical protein